ncbi:MAG: F0F1 ATP synthase subunit epsilon [Nocardioides sp.]
MSDKTLHVEVVAAERLVWSGPATMLQARTAEGEIGILADHAPVLSVMLGCPVEITEPDGAVVYVAVGDGFLSVADNRVSVLADRAALATEIDRTAAQADLDALGDGGDGAEDPAVRRLAEARLAVAQRS